MFSIKLTPTPWPGFLTNSSNFHYIREFFLVRAYNIWKAYRTITKNCTLKKENEKIWFFPIYHKQQLHLSKMTAGKFLSPLQRGQRFPRMVFWFLTLAVIHSFIQSLQVMLTSPRILSHETMRHISPHQNIPALLHPPTCTSLHNFSLIYSTHPNFFTFFFSKTTKLIITFQKTAV